MPIIQFIKIKQRLAQNEEGSFHSKKNFSLALTLMKILLPPWKKKSISWKSTSRSLLFGNFI